jgi:hypothetical protein
MAKALASFGVLTAVHKHYSVEQWQAFVQSVSADVVQHVMVPPAPPMRILKNKTDSDPKSAA